MLVSEVAKKLGKSPQWVRRLIKDGELVAGKLGTQWVVSEHSLARYQEKQSTKDQT